jgi:putative transposase
MKTQGGTDIPVCAFSEEGRLLSEPRLEIRRRNLPHWSLADSTYFVTFRLASGELLAAERAIVLDHVRSGDPAFYRLAAALVMPDHVHLLIRPNDSYTLSRVMKGIKGVSARRLNQSRGTTGQIWQDESWDRIVRDPAEFDEKLNYMADNPRRAGLVTAEEIFDGWFCSGAW